MRTCSDTVENDVSKDLSQIVNELFANPSEGKELSSQIKRLGDEIRKVLHGEDTIFGKFHGLLDSFREVIPEETQRYHAALKALATTAKLDNKEIMKAFNGQLEELKIVEKGILPSLSAWSDGLKDMEARSKELKGEISELREKLRQLESEEKTVQAGIAAREKDLQSAERTIKDLFADIGKEITAVNRKIGELTGEPPVEEPAPEKAPGKKKKKGEEKNVEITVDTVPEDSKFQKKCPMCGGRFNFHELEHMWQCYTCGHEESTAGDAPGGSGMSEQSPAGDRERNPDPPPSFVEPLASMANERMASGEKKRCPGCGKTMFHYPKEKAWRCNSCGYERRSLN
jgi:ribosomal protein L37AE/L43A